MGRIFQVLAFKGDAFTSVLVTTRPLVDAKLVQHLASDAVILDQHWNLLLNYDDGFTRTRRLNALRGAIRWLPPRENMLKCEAARVVSAVFDCRLMVVAGPC